MVCVTGPLAISDSFEYLCYGSRPAINICGDRLSSSESDVYRRHILTTKVDPRAVRVKDNITTVIRSVHQTGTV